MLWLFELLVVSFCVDVHAAAPQRPNELAGISMIAMAGMPNAKTEKMNMIGITSIVFENT